MSEVLVGRFRRVSEEQLAARRARWRNHWTVEELKAQVANILEASREQRRLEERRARRRAVLAKVLAAFLVFVFIGGLLMGARVPWGWSAAAAGAFTACFVGVLVLARPAPEDLGRLIPGRQAPVKAPEHLWCVVLEAPYARQGGIVVSTHENDFMANDALIETRHGQLRVPPESRYPAGIVRYVRDRQQEKP